MSEKICIIGLWHQGIVAAACLADLGYDVLAVDHDAEKISTLSTGKAPLFEPGLDDLLKKALDSGRLQFSSDVPSSVKGHSNVFFMFDTPVDENDQSDLTEIFVTANEIAPNLEADTVLFVTAQVPVGSCDKIAAVIREANPDATVSMAYSPENLRLGQAIERFLKPPLPVIGSDEPATLDRLEKLLSKLDATWHRVGLKAAEMTKHALNSYLATQVTFGNELGNICDEVGADAQEVAKALRLEERVGNRAMLFPGLGFAGGTLARDLQTLRGIGDDSELETAFLDGVWEANQRQNGFVVRKLKNVFGDLKDLPIAVLGLTYKPQTSTLRRSSSIEIIGDLVAEGAVISAHDPKAARDEVSQHQEFRFCEDVYETVAGARAVVIITGWPEYKEVDFAKVQEAMDGTILIDCNNMLDAEEMLAAGFKYLDVGRGRK